MGIKENISKRDKNACIDAFEALKATNGETRKIQILRPFSVTSRNSYSEPVTPPIGPAYLAAVFEKCGYPIGIIDAVGEAAINIRQSDCGLYSLKGLDTTGILELIESSTSILGVSMMFSQEWLLHRDLIKIIKQHRPDITIVVGGEHSTAMPEYILEDCKEIDYLITGEAELTFLDLVHALYYEREISEISGLWYRGSNGITHNNGLSPRMVVINDIPRPAWHLLPVENYFLDNWTMGISMGRNMPILATRGCPYQCTFCSNPTMWTTRYVMRSPQQVVDEIEWLIQKYNANSIDFFDLTAIVKKDWVLKFCDELEKRNIKITWQLPSGTRSEALDKDVLIALKKTGCHYLVYAPESASENTLKMIKKHVRIPRLVSSIKEAIKLEIIVKINLIIGFPDEKLIDIVKTFFFAWRMGILGVNDCNISVFSCYPGSELYRTMREEGLLTEPDDKYFVELTSQFDMTAPISNCKNASGYVLMFFRVFGISGFYFFSYLLRPKRIFDFFKRYNKDHFRAANLFEQRISDKLVTKKLTIKNLS